MSRPRGLQPTTQQQLALNLVRLPSTDQRCPLITAAQLDAIAALIALSISEVSA
jgi:hypothetical protein